MLTFIKKVLCFWIYSLLSIVKHRDESKHANYLPADENPECTNPIAFCKCIKRRSPQKSQKQEIIIINDDKFKHARDGDFKIYS